MCGRLKKDEDILKLFLFEFFLGVWKYKLVVLFMCNRIFCDVMILEGWLLNRRKRLFFGFLKRFWYFRIMEDEMIDYGFEEDSVRRELVL